MSIRENSVEWQSQRESHCSVGLGIKLYLETIKIATIKMALIKDVLNKTSEKNGLCLLLSLHFSSVCNRGWWRFLSQGNISEIKTHGSGPHARENIKLKRKIEETGSQEISSAGGLVEPDEVSASVAKPPSTAGIKMAKNTPSVIRDKDITRAEVNRSFRLPTLSTRKQDKILPIS